MKKMLARFIFIFLGHASEPHDDDNRDIPEFLRSFVSQSFGWDYVPDWWTKKSIDLTSLDLKWVMKKYGEIFQERMNIYIKQNPDIFKKRKLIKKSYHKNRFETDLTDVPEVYCHLVMLQVCVSE